MTQLRISGGMETRVMGFDYVALIGMAKIFNFKLDARRMDLIQIAERRVIKMYNRG